MGFRPDGLGRRVAALAIACLAAPVAAGLTPIAAHAGATVTVVTSSQWGPDITPNHYFHWVGEVQNGGDTTSKPYNASHIRITAINASSQAVETVDAEATILGPGQRSPFNIPMTAACVGCTLSVSFASTADPPNHKFTIAPNPLNVTTDLDGTQHITGTVTNNNTTTADFVKAILTFYDGPNGTGTVVDEGHRFLNNNNTSSLTAGQSAPFEVIRSPEQPPFVSIKAFADSTTAPSLPIVTPSPSPLDFGGVHVGVTANKTLTITNTGNDDLHITNLSLSGPNMSDFGLVGGQDGCTGVTVSPAATCTIGLDLTPATVGTRTAVLNVADDAADNPQAIALQGTGQAPTMSAGNLDFGDTVKGTTGQQSVVVTNSGTADLHVDLANTGVPGGTDFSADPSGCTAAVPPSQTCAIAISFAPTAIGPASTTLTITAVASDHATNSPKTVTINGTGTDPILGVSPGHLDFGTQAVGSPTPSQTVTVSNSGTGNLHVRSLAVSAHPGDYALSGCTGNAATVAAGSSCVVSVVFTARAAGDRGDTLTVTTDAVKMNSPNTVTLLGFGTGAGAALDKTSLSFGNVNVGNSSASQTVTLTNNGDADLTITNVTITGDFSKIDCGPFPVILHVNDRCQVTVKFVPTATGSRTGTLSFGDDAAGSSHQDVSLSGTGIAGSTGWQPLGGSLASSPAATSWGPGRLDVFAKGQNGALYHKYATDGANFTPWTSLGGSLSSNPAAVSWGVNRIDVFARGQDLKLYHMWSDDGVMFNSWQPLGGSLSSDPTASSWGVGRLDVFARGQDLALYHMFATTGTDWTSWQKLGGTLSSSAAAVSWGVNRIDVFARGQDLALYHMSSTNGTIFTSWQLLGGSLASDPAASSWGPTRLDVFAKGQNGALYHMSSDDGVAFTPWQSLGGSLSSNPAAASPQVGRIDLFARGQDLMLYHMVLTLV